MAKLRRFHFSFGNSYPGPVGYCATIFATSKRNAVRKLKAALPGESMVLENDEEAGVDYIQAYFNPEAVTEQAIDEVMDDEADK